MGSSGTDMSIIKQDFFFYYVLLCHLLYYYSLLLFANISLSVNMVLSHKIVSFLIFITF